MGSDEQATPATPTPAPSSGGTPSPPPLDQAPLSEFIARRQAKPEGTQPEAPSPPVAPSGPSEPPEGEPPEPPEPIDEPPEDRPPADLTRRALYRDLRKFKQQALSRQQHIQFLEERIAQLTTERQQQAPSPPMPPVAFEDVPPGSLQDFYDQGKTYEDWNVATMRYVARQEALKESAAVRAAMEAQAQQAAFNADLSGYPDRVAAAKTKHADLDGVLSNASDIPVSPIMRDILVRHPSGVEMMYWLGTHPEQANQLHALTERYGPQARPLVESLLVETMRLRDGGTSTNGASAVVHTSQAPAPITPVGGGSTTSSTPLDQAPLGEFIRRRNTDLEKRRSR
jgi:hypothetical protein